MIDKTLIIIEFKKELNRVQELWNSKDIENKWGAMSKGVDIQKIAAIKSFLEGLGITETELGITHDQLLELMR